MPRPIAIRTDPISGNQVIPLPREPRPTIPIKRRTGLNPNPFVPPSFKDKPPSRIFPFEDDRPSILEQILTKTPKYWQKIRDREKKREDKRKQGDKRNDDIIPAPTNETLDKDIKIESAKPSQDTQQASTLGDLGNVTLIFGIGFILLLIISKVFK